MGWGALRETMLLSAKLLTLEPKVLASIPASHSVIQGKALHVPVV